MWEHQQGSKIDFGGRFVGCLCLGVFGPLGRTPGNFALSQDLGCNLGGRGAGAGAGTPGAKSETKYEEDHPGLNVHGPGGQK